MTGSSISGVECDECYSTINSEGIMNKLNKLIRWCSGALFVIMGVRFFWDALHSNGNIIVAVTVSVILFILTYGLLNDHRWASRGSALIFIMTAIILPAGIFNPFTAADNMVAGEQPPTVQHTLLWLIPVEVLLLTIAFIIDPKRNRIDTAALKNTTIEDANKTNN